MKVNVYFDKTKQMFIARVYLGSAGTSRPRYFYVGRGDTREAAQAKGDEALKRLQGSVLS